MSAVTHDLTRESRETIRALALLGAFFFVAAIAGYLVTLSWSPAIPRDGTSLVVGRDFLALVGATALVFGPQVWIDFVTKGLPTNNLVLADPERIATPFYPTIFMNLRGIDLSYGAAMAVQLCFSAFAVAATVWAYRFRRDADPLLLTALFMACAVAGTPYLLSYDTLALTFAALLLLERGALDVTGSRLVQLVYWLPLIQIGLGNLHVPGPALIAPAFALYALTRLRASPACADDFARCITAR